MKAEHPDHRLRPQEGEGELVGALRIRAPESVTEPGNSTIHGIGNSTRSSWRGSLLLNAHQAEDDRAIVG